MTDEELIARLREIQGQAGLFASAAADRIEALVKARREDALELLAAHGQAQDAYEAQLKAEARAERLEAEVEKLREVERAARKLEENLGVEGVNVGSLRVDLYRALAALTQKEPTDD